MSKETEKIFNDFDSFIADKTIDSKHDINEAFNQFMSLYNSSNFDEIDEESAETSDDFLKLADSATSKREALKYAKKALEIEPNNLEAETIIAEISSTTPDALERKYRNLIDKATENLTKQGYFNEENLGEFWLIFETRPYMLLCDKYICTLIDSMKLRLAIAECERMLQLCENDNLGERYRLMHLYVYMEDEKSALELLNKYPESKSTQFLLPLSILYYRLGNLKKAVKYLRELNDVNKDTYKFFTSLVNGNITDYIDEISPYGYQPFTIQEFIIEASENRFLIDSIPSYYDWAIQKLKKII